MATRTVSVAGGNYNVAATWVELAVPTSSDDVVCTALSGNLTVNVSSVAKSIDFTNYVNTLTMSNTLKVSGNVTLVAAMTITGTANLIIAETATLTSNGKTFSGGIEINVFKTLTLSDNWTITGSLVIGSIGCFINGNNLYINNSIIMALNGAIQGTTTLHLVGTGSLTTTPTAEIRNNLTINTAGTITFSASTLRYGGDGGGTGVFTYTAGTVVTTGHTLLLSTSCTLNTNGITWNNINVGAGYDQTYTLTSNVTLTGLFNKTGNSLLIFNGSSINIGGSFVSTVNGFIIGTTNFIFNGTGTWSGSGEVRNPVNINTAGTLTISGTVTYGTGVFTYTAGTVVTTGSNLILNAGSTLNLNGISWNNITITTGTVTLTSLLTVNGTLDVGSTGTVTFAGTSGFTCHTFLCTTAGRIINFATGKTYTVTNSLIITGAVGSRVSFVSTSNGALFNLQAGATQSVTNCNATWINSSGGKTIYSNPSTLTNTINWSKSNGFITWFNSQF